MRDAALKLLADGRSIIPVRDKRPLLPWEPFMHRFPTVEEVTRWFTEWPDAGVGIVTGMISGLVVLDIDGMVEDPADWVYAQGLVPTLTAKTPRGGLHLYYQHPLTGPIKNAVRFMKIGGLDSDIRGDGGFVVAPPTEGYRFLHLWRGITPWVEPRPGAIDASRSHSLEAIDTSSADDLFAPVGEGGRNHAAARLAGYLLKTCKDEAAAWVQLRQWNTRNLPPMDERELAHTFESIAKRERMKPEEEQAGSLTMQAIVNVSTAPKSDVLMGDAWADAIEFAPERNGLVLDSVPMSHSWSGFCPGDLTLLAARPGTGKSTLAWGMAWELATRGVPVMLFSGEMSPADVARWMTQIRTGSGHITPDDWRDTLSLIRESRMGIVHRGIMTPQLVLETLAKYPSDFVIIDHIQKMRLAKAESRNHELEQVASELKALAMALQTSVFALCQLNRLADNVEHPTIAHLRDSGGLEQEADTVLGLSHVGDRLKQDPLKATVRLATLKSRHGPENLEQIAWFHKATKRFEWLNAHHDWSNVR